MSCNFENMLLKKVKFLIFLYRQDELITLKACAFLGHLKMLKCLTRRWFRFICLHITQTIKKRWESTCSVLNFITSHLQFIASEEKRSKEFKYTQKATNNKRKNFMGKSRFWASTTEDIYQTCSLLSTDVIIVYNIWFHEQLKYIESLL